VEAVNHHDTDSKRALADA
jgi:hypothetical protein